MAEVGNTFLTLADGFKQTEGDQTADIIEMLAQVNPIMEDAPAIECNQGLSNLTTLRTSLPAPSWRAINQGVAPGKGTTTQVRDTTGLMEGRSEIDEELVDIQPNPRKFRLNDAKAHVHGMSHEYASSLFYADTNSDPEEFLGLSPRFNALTGADNSNQIIDGGGAGADNMSIWLIGWGEDSCHLIYPRGTRAGLQRHDMGIQLIEDANVTNGRLRKYVEVFKWRAGLAVRDFRKIVRICNIDSSALTTDASAGANLRQLLTTAYHRAITTDESVANFVIYAPPRVMEFLHHQAHESNTNTIVTLAETGEGKRPRQFFNDIPLKKINALTETEATVS